jgi:soluble lytic murein transglycosylase-like protein
MKKRCNVLCLFVLVAFGFLAEAPILQGTGNSGVEANTPVSAQDSEKSAKSYVVIGSITNSVLSARNESVCGVQRKENYSSIVVPLAQKHGLDWRLVTAIMAAESSFNPCAKSPKGAMGLMQIMPAVAQDFKVNPKRAYEPNENIRAGVLLLKRLNKKYKGNLKLTVAAYNAGPGNVERYKGIPPFKETQSYVKKVLGYHKDLKVARVQPTTNAPLKYLKAR